MPYSSRLYPEQRVTFFHFLFWWPWDLLPNLNIGRFPLRLFRKTLELVGVSLLVSLVPAALTLQFVFRYCMKFIRHGSPPR